MTAIAHIVTWKLNGLTSLERARQCERVIAAFRAAEPDIAGLLRMDIGTNVINDTDAWDLGLYTVFESRAALAAYQKHPSHGAIKALMGPMRSARAQVDFELPS